MTLAANRFLILFTLLFVLAGCSTVSNTPISNIDWQAHQARLDKIEQFKISGKLGYISPEKRQSLNFQWQKGPNSSDLRLTSFLGQTVLHLTVTEQGAQVETYDDQIFRAQDAQTLIAQLTGLSIPVAPLEHWILGQPSDADDYILNNNNTLASLVKAIGPQRWLVTYNAYELVEVANEKPLALPTKLKLTQANTKLNIVISKWTLPQ